MINNLIGTTISIISSFTKLQLLETQFDKGPYISSLFCFNPRLNVLEALHKVKKATIFRNIFSRGTPPKIFGILLAPNPLIFVWKTKKDFLCNIGIIKFTCMCVM